jgi:4-methyl-5(b-hydroxyethyl)-thiazole monophosphate biosynthesis
MAKNKGSSEPARPVLLVVLYPGVADWEVSFPLFCLHPRIEYRYTSIGPRRIRTVMGFEVKTELAIDTACVDDFDGIYIPGGIDPKEGRFPRSLAENPDLISKVKQFYQKGKVVAAICGAPLVLGAAGLLKGRRFTSDITEDTRGWFDDAVRSDKAVVVDGNIITASVRGIIQFSTELARLLGQETCAHEIEEFFDYS